GRETKLPVEGETLPVDIDDSDGRCVVYNGLVMRDVTIRAAPEWMRYLLLAVGQRPLNNIVDLTNFLLHDLGQPMHAFDLERLRGSRIVVRTARDGESMVTLDNVERRLCREDLLICDGEGPVALAGIMGGEGSMVSEETRDVFLESANFAAASVRRSSVRLGLRTDSSTRFEKSLDPAVAALAARKFAAFLPEVAPGAVVSGPLHEPSGWSFPGREIRLRLGRASRVLGVPLEEQQVRDFLEPLGFAVGEASGEASGEEPSFLVSIPSWRATKDIEIEEDLIEEIGRRLGYGNIEARAPLAPVQAAHREEELRMLRRVQEILARDCGYFEVYNYSFLSDELVTRLGLEREAYLTVGNAIASHMSRVRRDVLPSLLGSLRDNLRREERVRLFEVGKGYRPERSTELERGRLPEESHQVVAVTADTRPAADGTRSLGRLRGHLEHLLRCVGRSTLSATRMDRPPAWMHPGRTAALKHPEDPDDIVAYVGELHPHTLDALELGVSSESGGAAAFCLDLRALLRSPEEALDYRPLPRFPEQPIDLAFLAAESVEVGSLTTLLYEASPKLVRDVRLFEVYRDREKGGIAAGMKSLNFTVVLGSEQRTLTTGDEEKFIRKVREAARSLGAELRGGE
ncbi:MAG: phenylalanine--tRNA ligase subunit beta, partial [Planctomycetota bacterium]